MCEYSLRDNGSYMPFGDFETVLSKFPSLYSLDLTGIGEPFCNPDFMKIIRVAKKRGLVVEFATNGILLKEGDMDELIDLEVDFISFSIDASTKKTYETIRQGASFDRLVNNISMFSKKVSKVKNKKPILSLNYTVSRENVSETVSLPQLAKNLGIDIVFYRDLITFDSGIYSEKDKLDIFPNEFRDRLKEQILCKANFINVNVNFCESLVSIIQKRKKFCFRPWMSCFVDVFGNFYPCCHLTQKNIDITPFNFGNIIKGSLKEIWNNPKYQALRKELSQPTRIPFLCQGCSCLQK
jgi:radical SAM protein with 4Fe4S-binding SPASM domain